MTRFDEWFLRRILSREVTQGPEHKANISRLYKMIREACEGEFTEDTKYSLDSFLQDCFEDSREPMEDWPDDENHVNW